MPDYMCKLYWDNSVSDLYESQNQKKRKKHDPFNSDRRKKPVQVSDILCHQVICDTISLFVFVVLFLLYVCECMSVCVCVYVCVCYVCFLSVAKLKK